MAKGYVDVETPKEIQEKALQAIEMAKDTGRLRKGSNEATKAVEKTGAELVVIAEDVDPPEVVMHLPMLCKEKKIPYVFVSEKKALGKSAGLDVPCAAIAIEKAGSASSVVDEIVAKMGGKKVEEKAGEEKKEAAAQEETKPEKPKKPRKPKAEKKDEVKEAANE